MNKLAVEIINNLFKSKLVGRMSFRVLRDYHDGLFDLGNLLEECEFGNYFCYNLNLFHDITKLYSENYDDQLWIRKEDDNIYFEELDSKEDNYEDRIVTRLLHIEYKQESEQSDKWDIRHMDFEYIFYTRDEFQQRKTNGKIKGSGKRKKIFKLDECCIPIDYKVKVTGLENVDVDILFIIFILQSFFKHDDLLEEYFVKII